MASSRRFGFTVNFAVSHTTGAKLLLDCLLVQGSQVGFGVPGESYLALLDAIYESQESKQDKFNFVSTRHEAGAAYMAEAYGKLTNTPGICLVTRGPGACHASIGIHTAHQNSTPMLVFVGQIETGMRHREAFQELDYASVFSSMTKWSVEIDDADRIPELISRGLHISQSGRKGPVVIALPENVLTQKTSVEPCQRIVPTVTTPDSVSINKTMDLLASAKNPVVLAGGGGWSESGKQFFKNFVESNHLPVVVSFRGQDILDNNSLSYCGEAGFGMPSFVRDTIDNSDLLLAINVRFGEILTDGYKLLDPKNFKKTLVHCHEGIDELGKIFVPALSICAGPNEVSKLLSEQSPLPPTFKSTTASSHQVWLDSLTAPKQPGDLDMSQVMSHLRTKLPKDTIIANGAGNFAIWSGRHILYGDQMRLLAPQSGAMGAGIPAAIAAKLAEPNRFVLCFTGDGDFQMSLMELGTALQHQVGFVIILINNGMYGTIRMHQERDYPGRVSGTDIVNPDFVSLAQSYGFFAERITETSSFPDAFDRACSSKSGALLELVIDSDALSPHIKVSDLRRGL